MHRLRTGDVAQIRQYGKNYVVLGKSLTTSGEQQVLLVKNGSIRQDGKLRKFPRGQQPKVYIVKPGRITRVHGHRSIDIDHVRTKVSGLSQVLIRMDRHSGIISTVPSISQIVQDVSALNNN